MACEWPVVRLEEVCEAITDGAHLSPKDCPGGMPMASVKDMARWGIDVKSSRTISHEDFDDLVRNGCQPQIGDVLIAKDGATCLDTVCEFKQPDKIVLLSSVAILRPSRQLHPGYLRYYLDSAVTRAMLKAGYVSGSAIPRVVLKDFRRAPILLPPLDEQKAIARILGTLDDKIELNRRMSATLEAMAQTLFKSWFVDFDPLRAKLDDQLPTGLDTLTANLFPQHLEESALGKIPQGWRVLKFADILTPSSSRVGNESVPEYSATVIGLIPRDGRFKKQLSKNQSKNKRIVAGDLVFGFSREVINFGLMRDREGAVSPVYEIFKIDASIIEPDLLERLFRFNMPYYMDILKPGAREGKPIDRDYLLRKWLLMPDIAIQRCFLVAIKPWTEKIKTNDAESRTLASLRDVLLPKLLSGDISVANVKEEFTCV